jgi:hypothetical protein
MLVVMLAARSGGGSHAPEFREPHNEVSSQLSE